MYTLSEADQQELAECLKRLELRCATFEKAMEDLARKQNYKLLNAPTCYTTYRRIWRQCFDPKGSRTIAKAVVVDMFIEVIESHPAVGDAEAKEVQRRAAEILHSLLKPAARQVRTQIRNWINLLPANARGTVLPGTDGISVKAGQKIGCAVGGDHQGCDAETVGVVPCSELGKVHRQFAKLDCAEGKWSITCLGERHPLRVNAKRLSFGNTVPFAHGGIIALQTWHFVVQDPEVLSTT